MVLAERDLSEEARDLILTHRYRLESYIEGHPEFLSSLQPLPEAAGSPAIITLMAEAARAAGVGPMAAVAGAISEVVGEGLRKHSGELLIENGGDLYIYARKERVVGLFTGEEELDLKLGLRIRPEDTPMGICTSSGRLGHSLSLGEASAATVLARSSALADAAATAVGNHVRGRNGIERGLRIAQRIPGVLGAIVVHGKEIGAWGKVELVRIKGEGAAE